MCQFLMQALLSIKQSESNSGSDYTPNVHSHTWSWPVQNWEPGAIGLPHLGMSFIVLVCMQPHQEPARLFFRAGNQEPAWLSIGLSKMQNIHSPWHVSHGGGL